MAIATTCLIALYLISISSIHVFIFYNKCFVKLYPLRLPFLWRKKQFKYSNILFVEIRKIKRQMQRPNAKAYVIFHFSNKKVNSLFFMHRAFIYRNGREILPLVKCLLDNNVNIRLNITDKNSSDYKILSKILFAHTPRSSLKNDKKNEVLIED